MVDNNSFERLRNLELTRDEFDKLGEALKKEEFRQLLVDYVKEIQDPENQKQYEEEIIQLEKERGNDVTFLHPTPCYVIKTSIDDTKKCFINICTNDQVKQPSSSPSEKNGSKGLMWSLPHSMSPPVEDIDNKGNRCRVFDILFHPDTLHLAQKNKAFRNMVNTTACNAIESQFDVKLDKNNLKFPKLKYKGLMKASIIRKESKEGPIERTPEEKEFFDKLYAHADESSQKYQKPKKRKNVSNKNVDTSNYTTPKYVLKHRRTIELEEFTETKDSKLYCTIPKELVLEIILPLLKSSQDITLDVTEKTVQLTSETPAKYKLNIVLPYHVNQDSGHAKFEKDSKKLIVTLPVKQQQLNVELSKEDSGVESDHGSPLIEQLLKTNFPVPSSTKEFLDDDIEYSLPEFNCNVFENTIAFTLNVKNVDATSVEKLIDDASKTVHVKFACISSSFYNSFYAFMVELPVSTIDSNSVSVEVWDNNVVLQITFDNRGEELLSYRCGRSKDDLTINYLEEPHIVNIALKESKEILKEPEEEEEEEDEEEKITMTGTSCESSGDELNSSPSKNRRGILKRRLRNFSRSISESSIDDCVGSLERETVEFAIPEDSESGTELSTSLKKTVRFNDVVSKQLYRFNSSILGQKKKNQKKALKKKKAHDRRHSESEASEVEDFKKNDDKVDEEAIFHLEM